MTTKPSRDLRPGDVIDVTGSYYAFGEDEDEGEPVKGSLFVIVVANTNWNNRLNVFCLRLSNGRAIVEFDNATFPVFVGANG